MMLKYSSISDVIKTRPLLDGFNILAPDALFTIFNRQFASGEKKAGHFHARPTTFTNRSLI
jgi:hypothetical protein